MILGILIYADLLNDIKRIHSIESTVEYKIIVITKEKFIKFWDIFIALGYALYW